jgi:hypothetical protein
MTSKEHFKVSEITKEAFEQRCTLFDNLNDFKIQLENYQVLSPVLLRMVFVLAALHKMVFVLRMSSTTEANEIARLHLALYT